MASFLRVSEENVLHENKAALQRNLKRMHTRLEKKQKHPKETVALEYFNQYASCNMHHGNHARNLIKAAPKHQGCQSPLDRNF